ncbi:MAG: c-type cytochrome [Bryobacteraceae bacterium]
MRSFPRFLFAAIAAALLFATYAIAQEAPFTASFPSHPKSDAATLARGKEAYKLNCAYCHGEDARGGDNGGTNILRSDILMKDRDGERLRAFLQNTGENGHVATREGVLKFNLTDTQASDLAAFMADISAFIHDFRLSSRDPGRMRPPTILVGDAKAGERYFQTKCGTCHSATGDLKGLASKVTDPRTLQQTWLMPAVYGFRGFNPPADGPVKVAPPTVTITMQNGQKIEGRLGRIDDFIVTMTLADGTPRTIHRDGDVPKVEVHDPMKPHKDLLPVYTDADIHNVTAFLATLK